MAKRLEEIQSEIEANSKILMDIESKVNQESQRLIGYSETCTKYKTEIQTLEKQKTKLLQEVEQVKSDLALMIKKSKEDWDAEYKKLIKERGEVDRLQAENQETLKTIQKQQADLDWASRELKREASARNQELQQTTDDLEVKKALLEAKEKDLVALKELLDTQDKSQDDLAERLINQDNELRIQAEAQEKQTEELHQRTLEIANKEIALQTQKEILDLQKAENEKKSQELQKLSQELATKDEEFKERESLLNDGVKKLQDQARELTMREKEITLKELQVKKLVREKDIEERIKELSK